ncbi:uncharacterized protein LOC122659046 [Telopea speciosissima]|uniref:uncharacterized protein LOC122659046 n=1 Tax=Telopea speciosissima TaxID=54955 RepID=UPI001CC69D5E|nr:uncharacterized protein LOC122659046 [Telopea speciosissima]
MLIISFRFFISFYRGDEDEIMAGGNFMGRVISYVVNELVVNTLANSPAFQRFAVRTSKRMEDVSNMAARKRQELQEQLNDSLKNFEDKSQKKH